MYNHTCLNFNDGDASSLEHCTLHKTKMTSYINFIWSSDPIKFVSKVAHSISAQKIRYQRRDIIYSSVFLFSSHHFSMPSSRIKSIGKSECYCSRPYWVERCRITYNHNVTVKITTSKCIVLPYCFVSKPQLLAF